MQSFLELVRHKMFLLCFGKKESRIDDVRALPAVAFLSAVVLTKVEAKAGCSVPVTRSVRDRETLGPIPSTPTTTIDCPYSSNG